MLKYTHLISNLNLKIFKGNFFVFSVIFETLKTVLPLLYFRWKSVIFNNKHLAPCQGSVYFIVKTLLSADTERKHRKSKEKLCPTLLPSESL